MATKLVLHRKAEWINRRQQFKVLIDGSEVGRIKRDETLEFDLEPGGHLLVCKMNWMSSNEQTINITEGRNVYLSVGSGMKFFLPLYILMIIGLVVPLVYRFADVPFPEAYATLRFALFVPGLLYMLAYWTILRKQYLKIEQDATNPFR